MCSQAGVLPADIIQKVDSVEITTQEDQSAREHMAVDRKGYPLDILEIQHMPLELDMFDR